MLVAGLQALAVPMEVEDEGQQLLDQPSLQPAMALLRLASSSIASAPPSAKAPARQPTAAWGITPMCTDGTTRSGERDEAVVRHHHGRKQSSGRELVCMKRPPACPNPRLTPPACLCLPPGGVVHEPQRLICRSLGPHGR